MVFRLWSQGMYRNFMIDYIVKTACLKLLGLASTGMYLRRKRVEKKTVRSLLHLYFSQVFLCLDRLPCLHSLPWPVSSKVLIPFAVLPFSKQEMIRAYWSRKAGKVFSSLGLDYTALIGLCGAMWAKKDRPLGPEGLQKLPPELRVLELLLLFPRISVINLYTTAFWHQGIRGYGRILCHWACVWSQGTERTFS